MEFIATNLAPIMFGSLIVFLLLGYRVAFSLAARPADRTIRSAAPRIEPRLQPVPAESVPESTCRSRSDTLAQR